jgi:hypothetical protein
MLSSPDDIPLHSTTVDSKGKRADVRIWPSTRAGGDGKPIDPDSHSPDVVVIFIPGNPGQDSKNTHSLSHPLAMQLNLNIAQVTDFPGLVNHRVRGLLRTVPQRAALLFLRRRRRGHIRGSDRPITFGTSWHCSFNCSAIDSSV